MRNLAVFVCLLLLAACGPRGVDLRQADLQALGPAPPGTPLAVTTRADAPPLAIEGAKVIRRGKAPGLPGIFQRWEIPGAPPKGLFSDY
ncbi:MAG: hypothetical protein QG621_474 [Patescibacteria group bacterium]|jgi:hypothetical protein|nr:hypothetical protein [Patescibacteria group bacterium]